MYLRWNRKSLFRVADVELFPGTNSLSNEDAKRVLADPTAKEKLSAGLLVVVKDEPTEPTAKEIVEAIADMSNLAELQTLAEDKRATVSAAAKARIQAIDEATRREKPPEE